MVVVAQEFNSNGCSWLYTNSSLYPGFSYVHQNIQFLPTVENVISDQNNASCDNQQGHAVAQFVEALHLNL